MNLTLGIETSSRVYSVILEDETGIVFDSARDLVGDPPGDISRLVTDALSFVKAEVQDVQRLVVDVGPGALSSIRAGVALANALSFSLQKPVQGVTSVDLMGFEASQNTDLPVLCVRTAGGGKVYAALFQGGEVKTIRFGAPEVAVVRAVGDLRAVAIAGALRSQVAGLLGSAMALDTGIDVPSARTFAVMKATHDPRFVATIGRAFPITEQSDRVTE